MRFLFIYPSPGVLGGIETLITRMCRWLGAHGHEVALLVDSPANWAHLLPQATRCVALNERFPRLYYYFHARQIWRSLGLAKPDVIKSFDLPSSWIACQLAAMQGTDCKVLAGVYNPSVFKWYYAADTLPFWDDNRLYLQNFLDCIPANARLFCGMDQMEELEQTHRQTGVLWPLPIDTTQFAPATRKPQWGRLVSVGRLAPMKEYNLYMIDLVKELREKGYDVTWTVYGEGPYDGPMRERIERLGLQGVISLQGTVPYPRFWQVLEEAYGFIGMGTSVFEAALFRVPNLFALPYDQQGLTFGPIYRLPRGSNGQVSTAPVTRTLDELERLLRLSPAEYRAEEQRVYEHAQGHQVEASMERFLDLARQAGPMKRRKSLYLETYPLGLLRRVLQRPAQGRNKPHPPAPRAVLNPKPLEPSSPCP